MQYEFQTEARQMLDLMIHSVYSNTDIFLRELVSNSSDALDKMRVEALTADDITMPGRPQITILVDREARTMTVQDNGIGMSREELVENIGTIARSGTREFMAALTERKQKGEEVSADLIGRFGVGFYSSFMVADRVEMITRRAGGEEAWRWESTGDGTYTIEEGVRADHGTTVILHLKESTENLPDYTMEWQIRQIVKQYSDFVSYPITMLVEKPKETAEGEEPSDETVLVEEQLNSMKAIWRRRAEEVTSEEYSEFFKSAFYEMTDPLETIHLRAEGTSEYFALLYIPQRAPYDLYSPESIRGVQLYVKRVFIMDDAKDMIPTWLRFLRGVVDSEDLPLNISREILQQNRAVRAIKSRLTKKTLETLAMMLKYERVKYLAFWNEFGPVLKEGLLQNPEHQEAILDVSLFDSTASSEKRTLEQYLADMEEGNDTIWYLSGEDSTVVANSPHLEEFRERGLEVLLLSDRVDTVWAPGVTDYKGKKFRSIATGDVDLADEKEKESRDEKQKQQTEEHAELLKKLSEMLTEHISEVRFSSRLRTAPAVIVTPEGTLDPSMARMMEQMGQPVPVQKRILELNPDHAIVGRLKGIFEADAENPRLNDLATVIYGGALLSEGEMPPDPVAYGRLVAEVVAEV